MGRDGPTSDELSAQRIEAWQRGEEAAVRAVFERYYPRAVRLAALSGMTLDEAQDCAQDIVLHAFERRRQLRDPQAFSLWFHRIATRRILNDLERRRQSHEVALDEAADLSEDWQRHCAQQPDEQVILAERRQALWESIQSLAPRYRVALALRYYGEFSLREIATMLGVREGTLRVTLHRALARLRQQVTECASIDPLTTESLPRSETTETTETTGGRLS